MNKYSMRKMLSLLLCIVLIAAMALFAVGCSDEPAPSENPADTSASTGEVIVKGDGATVFTFQVVDTQGQMTQFEVHTDEKTVGAALLALDLIAGEQGDYGLYVKTVNGMTLDWDKDGKFWAFYVNGESSLVGVDSVDVTAGAVYAFKAE